jgi:hypothetical protein
MSEESLMLKIPRENGQTTMWQNSKKLKPKQGRTWQNHMNDTKGKQKNDICKNKKSI